MSRIFVDTNVVIDLLARREPFYESAAKLFSLADKNMIILSVSTPTIANANYILSRLKSTSSAREILKLFRVLVEIVSLSDKIIDLSLNDTNFTDFEDGIQYYSSIENNQTIIVTRDLKGYKSAKLPVMTAEEYLTSLEL